MSLKRWFMVLALALSLPLAAKELTPYNHGYEQGKQAGRCEGRERVGDAGCYEGENEGYAAGVVYGQQQLVDAAWSQGLAQGQTDGAARGREEGQRQGVEDGQREGTEQGQSKAQTAADQAALSAATPRAQADGQARAALANPQADGQRDGRAAGLERATREANEKDFARARQDYHAKRYATTPKDRSSVRQAPLAVEPNAWPVRGPGKVLLGGHSCPGPDYRYLRYGSDNEEYQRGYRQGYCEGVRDGFDDGYDRQYRYAYDRAYSLGVAQAQVVNLQETVDQAYQEGFGKAHEAAFSKAHQAAHDVAFKPAYETAYSTTYSSVYPQLEAQHYNAIEESTFQSVYAPPYRVAFDSNEIASFDENYPKQAKLAYDEGWKAEAADFRERPVRILQAWRTPTDIDGVQLLTVKLRNFSDQAVPGNRVRVSLGDQTSRLYHPLPPQSEVTVTGLLRLRGEIPAGVELFAVIDNGGQRLPLGTVLVGAEPLQN